MKLHYVYDSPVCLPDGTPPFEADPKQFTPTTRPGTRAPHAWLADDSSILDLFGDGFVLLRLGARPPDASPLLEAAAQCGVPMRAVAIADPEVAALYERPLVLVRPDGHVAWRGNECPANAAAVVSRVRGTGGPAMSMSRDRPPAQSAHLL
jgi:hypothetical protein